MIRDTIKEIIIKRIDNMIEESFLYLFLSMGAIIALFVILVSTIQYIKKPGAKELGGLIIFSLVWAISSFLEIILIDPGEKLLWRNISQIGIFMNPLFTYLFVNKYTARESKFFIYMGRIIALIQSIAIVLIFTDFEHHLMRKSVELITESGITSYVVNQTSLGKIFVSFNYLIMFICMIKLIRFIIKSGKKIRMQAISVLLGISFPSIFGFIKAIFIESNNIVIPLSVAFIPGSYLLYLGFKKYNLLDIQPIARNKVFEVMADSILVFSKKGKIIDYNEESKFFLRNITEEDLNLERAVENKDIIELRKLCVAEKKDNFEWSYLKQGIRRYYDICTYPLFTADQYVASVVIIKDITTLKRQQKQLEIQAKTDGLTRVLNHEAVLEKIDELMNSSLYYNKVAAFGILDIDFFKHVNDTYGHLVGDNLLKQFAKFAMDFLREDDIFGRLGGDEICIYLFREDINKIEDVVNKFVTNISKKQFFIDDLKLNISISMGIKVVSDKSEKFQNIYVEADEALYEAKNKGRNKVCIRKS